MIETHNVLHDLLVNNALAYHNKEQQEFACSCKNLQNQLDTKRWYHIPHTLQFVCYCSFCTTIMMVCMFVNSVNGILTHTALGTGIKLSYL